MTVIDARLHLLDRQLLDHESAPVGIVDDLELDGIEADVDIAPGTAPPRVTTILSGQVMITRILGGAPPRSMLHEIPWKMVASVGVTVQLTGARTPSDADWIEHWLRDHVVARIPGGRHAAE
ncbi:PRC-barrel domain-containing protein [Mycolicibacterium houstonense]|uniref:PRC-barrel domain-containing protein n=1 Tax=Mycolicibacterium houstonense TaxID=146021 RepID=UPI003F9E9FCA